MNKDDLKVKKLYDTDDYYYQYDDEEEENVYGLYDLDDDKEMQYDRELAMIDLVEVFKENSLFDMDEIYVVGKNTDWLGRDGYKIVDVLHDKHKTVSSILPEYEHSIQVYLEETSTGHKEFYMRVYSHDVPTGSTWHLYPMPDIEEICDDAHYKMTHDDFTMGGLIDMLQNAFPMLDVYTWAITNQSNLLSHNKDKSERLYLLDYVHEIYIDTETNTISWLELDTGNLRLKCIDVLQ